jgi:hypothetical protein
MKRSSSVVLTGLILSIGACSDDRPIEKASMTSPTRPRLTLSSLPSSASTVCVAAVKERDQLLASSAQSAESRQVRIDALDALVEDTCY